MADTKLEHSKLTQQALMDFFHKTKPFLEQSHYRIHRETHRLFESLSQPTELESLVQKQQNHVEQQLLQINKPAFRQGTRMTDKQMIQHARNTVLVLDLDDTVLHNFADNERFLDKAVWEQCVFKPVNMVLKMNSGLRCSSVCLINPHLLSELIEAAYRDFGGIAICTAGDWEKESILSLFRNELYLTDITRRKLDSIVFVGRAELSDNPMRSKSVPCQRHSVYKPKFDILAERIQQGDKLVRKHIVLFDDQERNLQNSQKNQRGVPCMALQGDTSCYEMVLDEMFHSTLRELEVSHRYSPLLFGNRPDSPVKNTSSPPESHWAISN